MKKPMGKMSKPGFMKSGMDEKKTMPMEKKMVGKVKTKGK